jgi:hypothetical protein
MNGRRMIVTALTLTLVALAPYSLRADVRADEKTKIEMTGLMGPVLNTFGGKAAHDGVTQTISVKGDRKASVNDERGQIIDLAEEKVYDLDFNKKSYKVTTFAELRRRMEEAQKKAQERANKQGGKSDKADTSAPPDQQMEMDFDLKNTGQKKTINGFDTHQVILTVTMRQKGKTLQEAGGMVMTTDMWLAPAVKEMKEIHDFDLKYMQKMNAGGAIAGASAEDMAAAMAMYPMMKQAMARMSVEGGKVDGTPILTVMTMDAVKSDEQVAAASKQTDDQKTAPPTNVGSFIGGLAKRAAAKKAAGGDDGAKARATFMTSTTEVLKIAPKVAAEDVAVPAGFKETK